MDAVETQLAETALDNVRAARNDPAGQWPPGTLEAADEALTALLGAGPYEPPPEQVPLPEPVDEDWANLLSGAAGIGGANKWQPGSTGCDLFVARGTIVTCPHRAYVTFQSVPGGPMPIGEMLLQYDDGRAVRYRHVQSVMTGNGWANQGAAVAIVYDPSMDLLHWPAGYPTPPDGYQHLDLSLATSAAKLNPTGGAGGDVDADYHIWVERGGIPNIQIVSRTPGPVEGSQPQHTRAWEGYTGVA